MGGSRKAVADRPGNGRRCPPFMDMGMEGQSLGEAAGGDRAYAMVQGLLRHNIMKSMFATHPPMQIDGNLGIAAGMAEMLVQSHADTVELLPALPSAWKDGSVKGLKARGNITVDVDWKDGRVTGYRLTSPSVRSARVRVNGRTETVAVHKP